jgi:membrane fusion protein (multidrug efflux system)
VLTSVSQVDPIKAYFTVSEQVFLDFHRRFPTERTVDAQRKRMPLQLMLADGTTYEHAGRISVADREVSAGTGTIRVAGVFPNPDTLLRPGGYGRVRLSTRTAAGAMLIPQRAVTELQGSYQVAVVDGGNKVSIRSVTVGDRIGTLWIVTDGLKAGERVIVEGFMKVRDGAVVTVVPDKSPESGA